MRYRAILFDCDGTLMDSYAAIAASVNHVRARAGLPPLAEDVVRGHVGQGLDHLLAVTVPGVDVEAGAALYRTHHPGVLQAGTRLLPGARELLAFLSERGTRLAVCSNKPVLYTRELVTSFQLEEYVEQVLGPEDVPHLKPAPDMLLEALTRLERQPDEALYIGDMTIDIETARNAGIPVWAVATGSHPRSVLEAARPDRLLASLDEARDFLTLQR